MGFKLAVPDLGQVENGGSGPAPNTPPRCRLGLDRRYLDAFGGCQVNPPQASFQCGVMNDGDRCNGRPCTGPSSGCPTCVAAGPGCKDYYTGVSADICENEADFVPGSSNSYGGCTEMFNPIATMRNQYLDPSWPNTSSVDNRYLFTRNKREPSPNCAVNNLLCTANPDPRCLYRGVTPDLLGSWPNSIDHITIAFF